MKHITTLHTYGKTYEIGKDAHGYWGIDCDLLDANGKAKIEINGITGNLRDTLTDCLNSCKFAARVTDLQVNGGYDLIEALRQAGIEIYGSYVWDN